MPAKIIQISCDACGACGDACPADAVTIMSDYATVDNALCMDCGICLDECPNDAIEMIDE